MGVNLQLRTWAEILFKKPKLNKLNKKLKVEHCDSLIMSMGKKDVKLFE